MRLWVLVLLSLSSLAHARGESAQVRICRDAGTGAAADLKSVVVLDGLIRFKVNPADHSEMQLVTEIIDPIGPGADCREIPAWVVDNPAQEALPKAGSRWRADAFVREGVQAAVPPKVLDGTPHVTRAEFSPYKPWEAGRVSFNVTALEDFKPMPRNPSPPPVIPH
ncbi:MAG: hypothetical protein JOY84_18810 [Curvibacter sp.]|nr:hypothetical protein [Curvibacter sp.]